MTRLTLLLAGLIGLASAATADPVRPKPGMLVSPSIALTARGWTLVTGTADTMVYMKRAPSPEVGPRRVWTAYDLAASQKRSGSDFRSVASLGEFNCRKRTARTVEERFHAQAGLEGRSWRDPKFSPTEWEAPQAGSIGSIRLGFACAELART